MNPPRFFTVKQSLQSHGIRDLAAEVTARLQNSESFTRVSAGQTVAVAVGSRGIDRIDEVAKAVVANIRQRGADPFIVPAMGSHGGATDEGQANILASLGITADSVGCPIKSSMDTVPIGQSDGGIELFFDRHAASADHVIAINRIKPHTRLTGTIQSGLCKILMIGLGKHRGAIAFHPAFRSFDYRLDQITADIIPKILGTMPVLIGIALVEDSHDSVGHIEVVDADRLLDREPELFEMAVSWMPKLPFDDAQLLIVDEIGKEISGTGLDTNVVGRKWHDKLAGPDERPKIDEIYVRSLTEKTAGNASGIGIAEYTHRSVVETIDHEKTRINCITAGHPTAAAVPVWFENDREVLEAVCAQSPIPAEQRRWLRIRNTLDLERIECSEAFLQEARRRDDLELFGEPEPLRFDPLGDFAS